jgi:hypothetical protein
MGSLLAPLDFGVLSNGRQRDLVDAHIIATPTSFVSHGDRHNSVIPMCTSIVIPEIAIVVVLWDSREVAPLVASASLLRSATSDRDKIRRVLAGCAGYPLATAPRRVVHRGHNGSDQGT